MFAVAGFDTEKIDSFDVRSPGAILPCVAEAHVDGIGIAEPAILEPRSNADFENLKPSSVAVAGYCDAERNLLGGHGRIDQVPDIQLGVGVLLERLRTLHLICQHLDQARIESSRHSDLDLLRTSWRRHDIPRPVLDVL